MFNCDYARSLQQNCEAYKINQFCHFFLNSELDNIFKEFQNNLYLILAISTVRICADIFVSIQDVKRCCPWPIHLLELLENFT